MAKKRPARPRADAATTGQAEIKADWTVENVVATVALGLEPDEKIDLNQIARKFVECEYNPERFPGLVMRIADPKATILIFSTGKMVVTGLRDASETEAVVAIVIKNLKQAKVNITAEPEITIQNLVASGDLHVPIDLNEASIVMENAMYEPEVFPGLIYRMQEPKTVFLIFSTGRIVCTGAKTKEMVGEAVEKLVEEVKNLGLAMIKGGFDTGEDEDFI
ncbi:MAG TPA: TATA-box-binding protein [Candidatus Lokiarchaeia archaeon]|nr:TATA-box-binding protein [Candidatus Lokiarchaeia archaeon]